MAPPRKLRKASFLPLLFLVAGALPAQTSTSRHPLHASMSLADQARLRTALDAYDAGHPAQAEPALRDLATRYAANYQANEALGSLYAEAGDFARALPYLNRAVAASPKQAIAQANLGAALLKLGRTGDAVAALQKASALDPKNAASLSNLGQALLTGGKPAQAAVALASASALAPNDSDLKYNLALALYNTGSAESAARAAEVLSTLPAAATTDQVHALAADAEERAGHFPQALTHFQAAAQQNPTDANLYALVIELLRHWTWPEAIKVAEFATKTYPNSTHFYVAAGIGYYANNDYKQAIQVFSHLLETDPNNAAYADLLGRSCSLLAENENSGCAGMYAFAESHPGNAVITTYAAVALLHAPTEQHDFAKAATLLEAALAADPKYAEAWFQMGVLDQAQSRWAESAANLERSIALRPAFAEAHYRLSRAYSHMGRRDEARHEMELHQTYSQQAKDSLNARMQEVMKFVLQPS